MTSPDEACKGSGSRGKGLKIWIRFMVQGFMSWFRVEGMEFGVQSLDFGQPGSGLRF